MAGLRKADTGIYRVRFRFSGRQFFRSCETAEEKAAQNVLTRVEETIGLLKTGRLTLPPEADVGDFILSGGKVIAKPVVKEKHTLGQVVKDYFAAIPAGALSENSLATARTHLDHFTEILKGTTPIDSIGVAELQGYVTKRSKQDGIRGRKIQAETIRKELVTFGTMRRFAKARGWCDGDIDRKAIKLPKGEEKPPFQTWKEIEAVVNKGGLTDEEKRDQWDRLFLREAEVRNFLAHIEEKGPAWLHVALAIAAYTGARRSEILRSEVRDFDFDRGTLTLREKKRDHTKRLSYRRVDIHPRLSMIVKAWLKTHPGGKYTVCTTPNTPIAPDEALRTFECAVAGSKWSVLRGWHVLRHSFASICALQGIRETTISAWMGHQTVAMKARYRHLFPEETRKEMAQLFAAP
jgi:integrase